MVPYFASAPVKMVSHSVNTVHCPFCKQAISAELAQHGGNCPKCMLEIPGEDAPTDPGAHLRAKQDVERQVAVVQQRRRRWIGWAIGGVLLVAVGAIALARLKDERDALTYNLDDYYVMPLEDIVAVPAPPAEVPVAEGTATAARTSTPVMAAPRSVTTTPPEGTTTTSPRASASMADAAPPPEIATAGTGAAALGGADIGVSRVDVALSDPAEIKAMIGRVLAGSRPQLNACYQQRLKQVEGLRGTWDLQFTVGANGAATGVTAKGRDRADSELEACMARAVSGWKFSKLVKPVGPVQVPFQFSAS